MARGIKYITIILVIFTAPILLSKVKLLFEGEKGRIKRIIYATKTATETEDLFRCISCLSRDYSDKYGNTHRSMLLIAQKTFDLYDNIIIGIRKLSITLDTNIATAEVQATVLAKNIERKETNIFETDTVTFIITFQKEDEDWKVIKLEFTESGTPLPRGIT